MKTPIPTKLHAAPVGMSWNGSRLELGEAGLRCDPGVSPREQALLEALQRIVLETLYYSPVRPMDSDSYLPEHLVQAANKALAAFGMDVKPTQEVAA